MKYKLWDMSWKEAKEAFENWDTVIVPTGTLHGHGPTPISIDASSVEKLADEVGKRTGMIVLPVVAYGDDDKMIRYPGSIGIGQDVLEGFYTDICRSLQRNGVRKVVFINGHGGNKEALTRTGRNVRELGMLIAIVEWWWVGRSIMPDVFPPGKGSFMEELAVATAIQGKEAPDVRPGGYKGEWGDNPTRRIFGDKIQSIRFNDFTFKGAPITIPVDAWDIDVEAKPEVSKDDLEVLAKRGELIIQRIADYMAEFVLEFRKIDVQQALRLRD
jgi:creatinine amidohydrolase/Fe(II)-dependent formamide hydrolase-like protein